MTASIDNAHIPTPAAKDRGLLAQAFIAGVFLVIMCTQYWPIEGYGTSMVKVPMMCLSPLILLFTLRSEASTKVIIACGLCILWKLLVAYFQPLGFRPQTLAYSMAFFFTYMMFYTLVHNGCFTLARARILLESLLWAYIIVLIIQQLYSLAGGGEWALINLSFARNHVLKCQSLSQEPSSSGRIMGALFYALLKIWEYQKGKRMGLSDLLKEHWLLTAAFIYSMVSMQSATAMLSLLVLTLYFLSVKYVIPLVFLFIFLPVIQEITQSHELDRLLAVVGSTATGDVGEVISADGSAAARIVPMLNLLHADFSDIYLWLGHGIDTGFELIQSADGWKYALVGEVLDIGLIGYLLSLILVFTCAIRPFISLPTLMFFIGIGGGTGNIAYTWGILMIFTVSSFFFAQNLRGIGSQAANGDRE